MEQLVSDKGRGHPHLRHAALSPTRRRGLRKTIYLLMFRLSLALIILTSNSTAQWMRQDSPTTADLRGISSVDDSVAWASGTKGTVIRTTDGGEHWHQCAVPDAIVDGADLDLRGVQAWDANNAVVMASGEGAKSRLYKTNDGCKSWTLLLKNTEPDGFYDAFWFNAVQGQAMVLGDPVKGQFTILTTENGGLSWRRDRSASLRVKGLSFTAFAASNSSIARASRGEGDTRGPGTDYFPGFVTGGQAGAFLFERWYGRSRRKIRPWDVDANKLEPRHWSRRSMPLASGAASAGAFAIALRYTAIICHDCGFGAYWHLVVVGGNYEKPSERTGTAAASTNGGWTWNASTSPPHGYRSAVQWSEPLKVWISAGPNGSDISKDDGITWQPLDDGNWNALSLPFIVGPSGRIGKLRPRRSRAVR